MIAPSLDEPTRTTDAIIAALSEAGIELVLGMPGGLTGPLWRPLHDHPIIRAIQVREESIGALMAEAYGRLTGQPAVVMGQGEWIIGNAGQGYMEALLGSSPVVILTEMSDGGAAVASRALSGRDGRLRDAGTRGTALGGVTKRVMVSHNPAQAVQHTQLAIKHALTGEPGPVGGHLPQQRPEGDGRARLAAPHLPDERVPARRRSGPSTRGARARAPRRSARPTAP